MQLPQPGTLPAGLVWNVFQKYFRGHTNQVVAQHWREYNQSGQKGDGTAALPEEKPKPKKSPPKPGDAKAAAAAEKKAKKGGRTSPLAPALAPTTRVIFTPSSTGRSGRVRKANSLYVGDTFAVDPKASALRVTEVTTSTDPPIRELLPYAAMLDKLAQRRDARPFAKPMKELWDEQVLTGYFEAITAPMDLRTVLEKLRAGEYNAGGKEAFAADVRLVWQNCMTYTPDPDDPFYQQAKKMSDLFEAEYEQLVNPPEESEEEEEEEDEEEEDDDEDEEEDEAEAEAEREDEEKSRKRPAPLDDNSPTAGSGEGLTKKRSHKKKRVEDGELDGATSPSDFASLVQMGGGPGRETQQHKNEIMDRLPQLKKRKLRHALDIVRKADDSVKSAMDGVLEEEEFALDLDGLSDATLLALHEYCKKQILGKVKEEGKLRVTLSLSSPTDREGGEQKPKRSHHKKKGRAGAGAGGKGPSPNAGVKRPTLSVKSSAAAAQVQPVKRQRTEETAAAAALQEEPIVGLDDMFGGPLDGLADVPIDEGTFGGDRGGAGGDADSQVTDGAGVKVAGDALLGAGSPDRVDFGPPADLG